MSTKPSGFRPPSQRQVWLGWVFDTARDVISVERKKCDKCQLLLRETLSADSAGKLLARDLAAVAGLANHIAEVFLQGRRRLFHVWAVLNDHAVYALWSRRPGANPVVRLTAEARSALEWWLRALVVTPERPLHGEAGHLSLWGPKSPEFSQWRSLAAAGCLRVIETDASKLHGWSYNLCSAGIVRSGEWPADFSSRAPTSEFINFKELWVAAECVKRESDWLRGWRVVFRMDNTAAIHYVNFRAGRIFDLANLAEELELAERAAGCWCLAVHLAGAANVVADAGSRDSRFADRWNNDPYREAVFKRTVMEQLIRAHGPFDCDLFCDREGLSAQAPRWYHPGNTAFEADVLGSCVWAHPPRSLAGAALAFLSRSLDEGRCRNIFCAVPEDPGAPWYRPAVLRSWRRRARWPAGSDLFRTPRPESAGGWIRAPRTDLPILLLSKP